MKAKRISRRTLLRGAGVAMALPWLETMAPAAPAAPRNDETRLAEPPLRMLAFYMPNGVRPDYWTPPGDDEDFELTPHLEPLGELKSEILLLENLWHENTVGRNGHWPKTPAWLSGGYVERTSGSDLDSGGVSLDQFAAQHIGDQTLLPTFELGLDSIRSGIDTAGGGFARMYGSFLSWRDPHTPVPKEITPQLAFDRLFRSSKAPAISSIRPDDPRLAASLQRDETSVLDLVLDQAKSLQGKTSRSDLVRLDEYFESVRSVEQRMSAALRPHKRWINEGEFPLERPGPGIPDDRGEHMRLMMDILALAVWSDTTRIGTFMTGDAQTAADFSFMGVPRGAFHSVSHHRDEPAKLEHYSTIVTWHVEQIAYFLRKLKSLDEGGTSLLDNSMVLFGASIADGDKHTEENLPIVLAGRGKGTLQPGRRIRQPELTPLCNLHLAMLQRMGIDVDHFGDSTGPLDLS